MQSKSNQEEGLTVTMPVESRRWSFDGFRGELGRMPLMMGIVNVTPDSFSDGGQFFKTDTAVEHALQLVAEGADILDVGGESTRPGAQDVPVDEELQRVLPVIKQLAKKVDIPISVDTSKAEVARQSLMAGARIVNDISGLTFDSRMIDVCREFQCGVVAMHIQGVPRTMQNEPHYSDVVQEICLFFRERLQTLTAAGVDPERIIFDPGIGFGKSATHNLQILSHIKQLRSLGRPVMIGHSRKRFLKNISGRDVDQRLFGTLGVSIALANQHADILRVHDVAGNRDAVTAFFAIGHESQTTGPETQAMC
ncbi:MAG: dihydropteroate synthase [Planctomycetales bacterium]|jgi:dihydropteroate synthase|nr:dihydropteroate synthase [Planctomycetales bacterium]